MDRIHLVSAPRSRERHLKSWGHPPEESSTLKTRFLPVALSSGKEPAPEHHSTLHLLSRESASRTVMLPHKLLLGTLPPAASPVGRIATQPTPQDRAPA